MKILVTGGAGFIGSHTCEYLLAREHKVVALDNFDRAYSPAVKKRNLTAAMTNPAFKLVNGEFGDRLAMGKLLQEEKFDVVLHLAAQAGVRTSVHDPLKYEQVNVAYLVNMLEALREHGPRKLVYSSSSSVYGNSTPAPFHEDAPCLEPVSPYGATKRAAEIFLGTYKELYDFKVIIVRPFTVYGPRQRPDQAAVSFMRNIMLDEPIPVFGDGQSERDYTYVTDVAAGFTAAVELFPTDFGIYNLGAEEPVSLTSLIWAIEKLTGKTAKIERLPNQSGDIDRTLSDSGKAKYELGFVRRVGLNDGLAKMFAWVQSEFQYGNGKK